MNLANLLLGPRFNRAYVRARWAVVLVEEQGAGRANANAMSGAVRALSMVERQNAISTQIARWLRITIAASAIATFGAPLALALLQITPGWWGYFVIAGNVTFALLIWNWRVRRILPLPALQAVPTDVEQRLASVLAGNDLRIQGQAALQRAVIQTLLLISIWTSAAALITVVTLLQA